MRIFFLFTPSILLFLSFQVTKTPSDSVKTSHVSQAEASARMLACRLHEVPTAPGPPSQTDRSGTPPARNQVTADDVPACGTAPVVRSLVFCRLILSFTASSLSYLFSHIPVVCHYHHRHPSGSSSLPPALEYIHSPARLLLTFPSFGTICTFTLWFFRIDQRSILKFHLRSSVSKC